MQLCKLFLPPLRIQILLIIYGHEMLVVFANVNAFQIRGKLKAPSERSYWLIEEDVDYWIKFRNVRHLTVKGGGKLDGSGQVWWQNSCKINESLVPIQFISLSKILYW